MTTRVSIGSKHEGVPGDVWPRVWVSNRLKVSIGDEIDLGDRLTIGGTDSLTRSLTDDWSGFLSIGDPLGILTAGLDGQSILPGDDVLDQLPFARFTGDAFDETDRMSTIGHLSDRRDQMFTFEG